MNAAAEAITDQTQPDPLEIVVSAPSSQQRAGNGQLVNGHTQLHRPRFKLSPEALRAAGKRKPLKERKKQSEDFAYTCHEMLIAFRVQIGLKPLSSNALPTEQLTAEPKLAGNGHGTCEPVSIESAPPPAMEITRDHAQIVGLITRAWDTALERHRVLSGVPDPGCRRPGEPVPKARKPTNRAPDSLNCGLDTPTGSMPTK